MKKRSQADTVHISTRIKEPLRRDLVAAAKRRAVSLNKELVARLEQSFTKDEAYGGAEIRQFANLMAASFALAGKRKGAEKGATEWTSDGDAYFAAVRGVVEALLRHAPMPITPLHAEGLKSAALTVMANQGRANK